MADLCPATFFCIGLNSFWSGGRVLSVSTSETEDFGAYCNSLLSVFGWVSPNCQKDSLSG